MVQIHDESANSSREDRGKLRKPRNRSNPRGGFVSSLPSPPSLTCNPPHVAPVRPLPTVQGTKRGPMGGHRADVRSFAILFPCDREPLSSSPNRINYSDDSKEQGEPIGQGTDKYVQGQEGLEHKVCCSRKFVVCSGLWAILIRDDFLINRFREPFSTFPPVLAS